MFNYHVYLTISLLLSLSTLGISFSHFPYNLQLTKVSSSLFRRLTTFPLRSSTANNDIPAIDDEPMLRIGHGFDIHRLIEGTKLVIGGVDIPFKLGADAHSDGDALYHW